MTTGRGRGYTVLIWSVGHYIMANLTVAMACLNHNHMLHTKGQIVGRIVLWGKCVIKIVV